MFCSSCGAEVLEEMSYCNRCGASLRQLSNQAVTSHPPVKSTGAAWAVSAAVALITLGGFALVFALVMAMITRGIDLHEGGLAVIVISLLVILTIDWLLIRQLPRLLGWFQPMEETGKDEKRKMSEKPVAQIPAPREAASSVTDHTTRTFTPVYRERDTRR
jgi:hypothetical protein